MNEKTVWESYTEEDKKKVYDFCEEYRTFLSKCKTERECVKEILKEAEAKGIELLKNAKADEPVLTLKSLEALEKMANGQSTKIIVPSDLQNLATLGTTIREMLDTNGKNN